VDNCNLFRSIGNSKTLKNGGILLNTILEIIISYLALYSVIWLHELGHAFFYWKYGCKGNWLKVSVKPYLFFSTPLPVDLEKEKRLKPKQKLVVAYAGIAANLLFAFIFAVVIQLFSIQNNYIELFIYQFITLHLSEAISYLVLGNIYLVSDMKGIAEIKPVLRPFNLAFGLIVSVLYLLFIQQISLQMFSIIIIFNLLVIICMGAGRIAFTYYYSKKHN
jgi:hypothetical protein